MIGIEEYRARRVQISKFQSKTPKSKVLDFGQQNGTSKRCSVVHVNYSQVYKAMEKRLPSRRMISLFKTFLQWLTFMSESQSDRQKYNYTLLMHVLQNHTAAGSM